MEPVGAQVQGSKEAEVADGQRQGTSEALGGLGQRHHSSLL
jgi:hypothetical protein